MTKSYIYTLTNQFLQPSHVLLLGFWLILMHENTNMILNESLLVCEPHFESHEDSFKPTNHDQPVCFFISRVWWCPTMVNDGLSVYQYCTRQMDVLMKPHAYWLWKHYILFIVWLTLCGSKWFRKGLFAKKESMFMFCPLTTSVSVPVIRRNSAC